MLLLELNGGLGLTGPGKDAGLRHERGRHVSVLLIKGMVVAGSMEVQAQVQGPMKDVPGSLRLTCGTGGIRRTS